MIPGLKAPNKIVAFSNEAVTFSVIVPMLPNNVKEAEDYCSVASKKGYYCDIIYQYTNRINGKRYIGQTIHPQTRHKTHLQNEKCQNPHTAWGKAIKKYTRNCFTYQVLELVAENDEHLLHQKLNEKEKYYIGLHQSSIKKHGYNIATGGWELPKSPTVEKAVDMFDIECQYIKSFPSISKANAQFGFSGPIIRRVCNHQRYSAGGYLWAWAGELPRLLPDKKVYAYDSDGVFITEFPNQYAAARQLGVSYWNIGNALKDKHRLVDNKYWRRYKNSNIPLSDFPRAIYAYDKHGDFVTGFPCLKKAAEYIGDKTTSSISHAIGRQNYHKGFYWRREYRSHL